jgi:hypothetical protein
MKEAREQNTRNPQDCVEEHRHLWVLFSDLSTPIHHSTDPRILAESVTHATSSARRHAWLRKLDQVGLQGGIRRILDAPLERSPKPSEPASAEFLAC